jgi:hypothetical protein
MSQNNLIDNEIVFTLIEDEGQNQYTLYADLVKEGCRDIGVVTPITGELPEVMKQLIKKIHESK